MKKSSNYEVALAVENFGHFAKVCKLYKEGEELKRMLVLTSQMAENYYCSGYLNFFSVTLILWFIVLIFFYVYCSQIENLELHHMSGLLVSIARIAKNMYDKNLYENEFSIIEKLSVFIVVSYPKVPNNFRYLVKNNLIKTIIIVGNISDIFLGSYLQKLSMQYFYFI